jgi:NAD(P)-dependent dehydrogenase (short-subunit alcohol dehydrogenase family)
MDIKSKTFLISGGASGLGLATAQMIVKELGHVVLLDINTDLGKYQENLLGNRALFCAVNVTDESSVLTAIDLSKKRFGSIHGLINCAGIGPARRVLGKEGVFPLIDFQKVININLIGSFNTLRLAANELQYNDPNETGERGVIINTASVAAFEGQIGQAAYAASKGGIVSMTLPIARELARFGIRVMTIAPGLFETPMMHNLPAEAKSSLESQVPFPPRLGKPAEYAMLVKQIIENPMLNGEVIRLDGAIRMKEK